jgi:hypothetical protein
MPQVTKAEIRPGEQGGEMTQALYAHMNNKKKLKKKRDQTGASHRSPANH